MKKTNNQPATKNDLKKVEQKLSKHMRGMEKHTGTMEKHMRGMEKHTGTMEKKISDLDKSILAYKGEIDFKVDDYFQKTEAAIKQSESRILGIVSEAMGELNTVRDTQEIVGQKAYDNAPVLDNHEERIGKLELAAVA
jgi:exonuclease VII small subunit